MGFFKALFGGEEETPEQKEQKKRERDFDVLKVDGMKARRIGQMEYASRCFKQALSIRYDNEIMNYLAECLLICGEKEEGYNTYEKLAELNPEDPKYLLSMAQLDEIRMNYDLMEKHCDAALGVDKENEKAIYLSARAKYRKGDDLKAIILLTQAITKNDRLVEAYLLRADILQKIDCLKDAEESLAPLLQDEEPAEEVLIRKANLCLRQKETDTAITYYNKAIATNPLFKEAYIGLSTAYSINHQLDLSLSIMNEALEYMPDFAEGFKERGRIKLLLNDKNGATDDIKTAMSISPEILKEVKGKFTNIEQEMNEQYKSRNPYGF